MPSRSGSIQPRPIQPRPIQSRPIQPRPIQPRPIPIQPRPIQTRPIHPRQHQRIAPAGSVLDPGFPPWALRFSHVTIAHFIDNFGSARAVLFEAGCIGHLSTAGSEKTPCRRRVASARHRMLRRRRQGRKRLASEGLARLVRSICPRRRHKRRLRSANSPRTSSQDALNVIKEHDAFRGIEQCLLLEIGSGGRQAVFKQDECTTVLANGGTYASAFNLFWQNWLWFVNPRLPINPGQVREMQRFSLDPAKPPDLFDVVTVIALDNAKANVMGMNGGLVRISLSEPSIAFLLGARCDPQRRRRGGADEVGEAGAHGDGAI